MRNKGSRAEPCSKAFRNHVYEHLPKQAPPPLRLVESQVTNDGLDTKDVKAATIFKCDNGVAQVDIVVVLARDGNADVGVYGAFWGADAGAYPINIERSAFCVCSLFSA